MGNWTGWLIGLAVIVVLAWIGFRLLGFAWFLAMGATKALLVVGGLIVLGVVMFYAFGRRQPTKS